MISTPKRILIGVSGGIAAYKSPELVRLLKKQGADVRVVMTDSAKQFITPLTLQTVSSHPVYDTLWNAMEHIDLARWPDLVLIAPATANQIAKLAYGLADDLLSTISVATTAPITIAPAMNKEMWLAKATQANVAILKERGVTILGPGDGEQACGEFGPGRMLEPEQIVDSLSRWRERAGVRVDFNILITAGPTQEPIDPVRFISNYSSGKMGFALAEAASKKSATVTLISGPVSLPTPAGVTRIDVKTAEEMLDSVMTHLPSHQVFISAAAVSDYRAQEVATQKIKKTDDAISLHLTKNPDILVIVGQLPQKPFLVGFAAETENLLENARQKLMKKNLDMIVANPVHAGKGFHSDYNEATVILASGEKNFPRMKKTELAEQLIDLIYETTHST